METSHRVQVSRDLIVQLFRVRVTERGAHFPCDTSKQLYGEKQRDPILCHIRTDISPGLLLPDVRWQ